MLPLEAVFHIVLSVLRALDYAHNACDERGEPLHIVHRDVSPGNILLHESGAVKLTDFGIARAAQTERRTEQGQLKGKLGYMSPEQVVGRELDARSDLFTLGIVFAEMLIGRPMFHGRSDLEILMRIRDADVRELDRANVPDDVKEIVLRALARRLEDRFGSAAEFAQAIEEVLRRRRMPASPGHLLLALRDLNLVAPRTESHTFALPRTEAVPAPGSPRERMPTLLEGARARGETPAARKTSGAVMSLPAAWRARDRASLPVQSLTYPELVERIVTGALAPQCEVSKGQGPFQPLGTFPELAHLTKSPSLAWDDALPVSAIDRRAISLHALPGRIAYLALARETGALVLRAEGRVKKVFFVDGVPEYVASTERSELLGECLIRRGQALRMEVEMALAMLPEFHGRLGDALVGLGVLRPIELFRAVLEQTEERIMEVLAWREGEIAFVPGARCLEETLPLGVKPLELLGRGVALHYTLGELARALAILGDAPLRRNPAPPMRLAALRLGLHEERILRGMRQSISLTELLRQVARERVGSEADVLRAVFIALSCDWLQAAPWPVFHSSRASIVDG